MEKLCNLGKQPWLFKFCTVLFLPLIACQPVTLTSNLIDGRHACPGQQVTFTCRVRDGTLHLFWASEQYIGHNRQLSFTYRESEGTNKTSVDHSTTVATLVAVRGDRITESRLHLTASMDISTASVKCSNSSNSLNVTAVFSIPETPTEPQNITVTKQSLPQQSDCVVNLLWLPPVNWNKTSISKYRVTVEYANGQSDTLTSLSLSANMVVKNCSIDAVIKVGAVDVCEREGLATNDSLADVLTSSSPVTTSTTPDQPHSSGLRTEAPGGGSSSSPTVAIVGGALGGVMVISAVIITALVLIFVKKKFTRHRATQTQDMDVANKVSEDQQAGTEAKLIPHSTQHVEATLKLPDTSNGASPQSPRRQSNLMKEKFLQFKTNSLTRKGHDDADQYRLVDDNTCVDDSNHKESN